MLKFSWSDIFKPQYLSQLRTYHCVYKFGFTFLHVHDTTFIYSDFHLLLLPTATQYCRVMMLLLISLILLVDMLVLSADCVTHFTIHPLSNMFKCLWLCCTVWWPSTMCFPAPGSYLPDSSLSRWNPSVPCNSYSVSCDVLPLCVVIFIKAKSFSFLPYPSTILFTFKRCINCTLSVPFPSPDPLLPGGAFALCEEVLQAASFNLLPLIVSVDKPEVCR